jgi:two-component system sensor histidine kinase/response regulator
MSSSSKIKILLVDDREDNLLSMQSVLEQYGYEFIKATSGQQALKILLHEFDFTLILMDVMMPNMNGFETASLIYKREKLRHIPIIFITAYDNNEINAFQGYQAGAVDYIYKPINPDLLRAKVSVFVELYRKNHQLLEQEEKLIHINNELEEHVRKRTEELYNKNMELEFKNSELTKVNNDLDNFIYTASHDLMSPVINIETLLTVQYQEFDIQDDEFKRMRDMTLQSATRLKNTIKDLTEISKVQKGGDADDIEMVTFHELLDEIKFDIKNSIEESKAAIIENFNVPDIKFSRRNIRSIIYNLISNAIKYRSPKRLPVITIITSEYNNYIVMSVSDNGLGINEHSMNKIFEMFKRLHDHVEGTGIGLYIVKRIMENSGGKIEVQSKIDVGTTFNLYFRN